MSNVKETRKREIFLRKEGMTSILHNDQIVAVTVLSFLEHKVFTEDKNSNNTYNLMYISNNRRIKKPQSAELQKYDIEKTKGSIVTTNFPVGELNEIPFAVGSYIDVYGVTKGKGFAGVMKRWNFSGNRASHGTSLAHRVGGSTGCRQDPGRTHKNKKMPGHLGVEQVAQQNLEILQITPLMIDNKEQFVILVRGSVPGPKKSTIKACEAIKKRSRI